ncbi:hypothetical protein Q8F55_000753 [Vanrija albida]|uniref:Helicase C-terminal domain-containing protein n=1 Tax=Vanrija albida TaxID=181172 RepID=A0ABR3QE75_9TREE
MGSPDPDREKEEVDENGEDFDLDQAKITAEDFQRHIGDADEQMRDLLAGAVGDGEGDSREPGDEIIDGFAPNIKLMPHQVRGVKWMRDREKGRKYGGILADDMGLGKTVQTLARIVEGQRTTAEKKVYKGGTLIIAPLAVMDQWANECRTKTQPGLLKVTTHHGSSRAKSGKELEKFDVVITTFDILRAEYNAVQKKAKPPVDNSDSDSDAPKKRKPKPKAAPGSLFDVKWYRIVIDEAQNIKNHKTQTAKAAVELRAKYRWCLTGTPIQNNVDELYSLFKFLRARPLDDWQTFKDRISSQVKEGRTGIAMKRLHIILKSIMLRRTKDATIDGKPILNLPARNVNVVECQFDDDEQAFYDALEHKTNLTMNRYLRSGTAMSNYTSVLSMLLRLRQACDHPALVTKSLAVDKDALDPEPEKPEGVDKDTADLVDMFAKTGIISEAKCEICFVVLEDQTKSQCPDCWDITRRSREKSVEPGDLPPSSAKIRKMLELLKEIDERSKKKEKTIIFSQFTSFLDLIEPFLRDAGIPHVRYDGSLRADQREDVLNKIRTSKSVRVILISFKAGSTGLNLTCCNNVILMDLWWNPALEDQAFDRAHRLGQQLDVHIHKLTIADTVENRILQLQDSKRELAAAALSGTGVKNMKLSMADILKLFQRSSHDDD